MSDGLEFLEEPIQPAQTPAKPVQEPKEPGQIATVSECHPDIWDKTGRLISHDHLNPV